MRVPSAHRRRGKTYAANEKGEPLMNPKKAAERWTLKGRACSGSSGIEADRRQPAGREARSLTVKPREPKRRLAVSPWRIAGHRRHGFNSRQRKESKGLRGPFFFPYLGARMTLSAS